LSSTCQAEIHGTDITISQQDQNEDNKKGRTYKNEVFKKEKVEGEEEKEENGWRRTFGG
jgi:hypothetical protein